MTIPLNYAGEIYRKSLHLLALAYPVGFLILGRPLALWIMIPLSLTALFLDFLRSKNKSTHAVFDRIFGFMMRLEERSFNPKRPVINGASWVTTSFTVLIFLFPGPVAVLSFILFMLGDAAAALVGRKWGTHPFFRAHPNFKGSSTLEGTLSFVVAGLVVAFALGHPLSPVSMFDFKAVSLIGAVCVAAALEAAPLPVNDNLIAPLGAALFLLAMGA